MNSSISKSVLHLMKICQNKLLENDVFIASENQSNIFIIYKWLISLLELLPSKVVTFMIYNLKYKENCLIINYFAAIYLEPRYMCLLNAASKKKLLFISLQHGHWKSPFR